MIKQEGRAMSQRALRGTNVGELWLIDAAMKDEEVIEMDCQTLRFVRHRGGIYSFGKTLWDRKDGDVSEEQPTMIYVVGECQKILERRPELVPVPLKEG